MSWVLIKFIHLYRFLLSPFIGNQCRFYPTCSHYGEDALKKHGAMKGIILIIWRLARCQPWGNHGIDPVPDKFLAAFKRAHYTDNKDKEPPHADAPQPKRR